MVVFNDFGQVMKEDQKMVLDEEDKDESYTEVGYKQAVVRYPPCQYSSGIQLGRINYMAAIMLLAFHFNCC